MTPIPFEKISEEDLIFFSGVTFDRNKRGQMLMYVSFSNGKFWRPAWDDVHAVFDKALFVEKLNKRLIGKGKPKTNLVYPILRTLKSRGYLKKSMFVCDITAEAKDGTALSSKITVEAEKFKRIKKTALNKFTDRMANRMRDLPTFEDKTFRITQMAVTEYVRKRTWDEPIEEDYYF